MRQRREIAVDAADHHVGARRRSASSRRAWSRATWPEGRPWATMRVRWGEATPMISAMRAARRGGVGGQAAGAVLLGEAEDQGGGAAGLGHGVEGLEDGGGGHVGEALLADPVARAGARARRPASRRRGRGSGSPGSRRAGRAWRRRRRGRRGRPRSPCRSRRCRARAVMRPRPRGTGCRRRGCRRGPRGGRGASARSGGPTQASVKSRMVRWMRAETRQTSERRRFSGSKSTVSGWSAPSKAMARPSEEGDGQARCAGRRKCSRPAGVRLTSMHLLAALRAGRSAGRAGPSGSSGRRSRRAGTGRRCRSSSGRRCRRTRCGRASRGPWGRSSSGV